MKQKLKKLKEIIPKTMDWEVCVELLTDNIQYINPQELELWIKERSSFKNK